MIALTRTLRQWWVTARRLEHREIGRHDLADQIRWTFPADPNAPPHTPVTVSLLAEDAAVIELHAPLDVWWMPTVPDWMGSPTTTNPSTDAVAAAEAIIAAHQRREPD